MVREKSLANKKRDQAKKTAPFPPSALGQVNTPDDPGSPTNHKLEQRILNIFQEAHKDKLNNDEQSTILQTVKQHLYNRDFAAAFGDQKHLWSYLGRWSPSRALAYLRIFRTSSAHIDWTFVKRRDEVSAPSSDVTVASEALVSDETGLSTDLPAVCPTIETNTRTCNVLCLGGGAGAELVAAAAWASNINDNAASISVHCVDIAAWHDVLEYLSSAITNAPVLSEYASAEAKAENKALLPPTALKLDFTQLDLLSANEEQTQNLVAQKDLITIMFTLNELYTTSLPKTQAFLMNLTSFIRKGALLLVVDSPGSYSTVTLNGAEKKYPMQWLLDYTLLGKTNPANEKAPQWTKIISEESVWYRLPKDLQYPIELENMRYQIHLYRRI